MTPDALVGQLTHKSDDFLIFAMLKQTLLEAWATNGSTHQFRVDGAQRVEVVLFDHGSFDLIQQTGITHLRLFTLWRIAIALLAGEGFFKDKAQVKFSAPAKAFGERQR